MSRDWLAKVRRGLRKPPTVILRRLRDEAIAELDRFAAPGRAARFTEDHLVVATGAASFDELRRRLDTRPTPAAVSSWPLADYDKLCPGDHQRILHAAKRAIGHEVDLL